MITHYSTHYGNHLNTSCVKCVKSLQLKNRQDIKSTVQDSQKSTQSQIKDGYFCTFVFTESEGSVLDTLCIYYHIYTGLSRQFIFFKNC